MEGSRNVGREPHTEDRISNWAGNSPSETNEVPGMGADVDDDTKQQQGTVEEVVSAKDKKARR